MAEHEWLEERELTEVEWLTDANVHEMLREFRRRGGSHRKMRLFAVACCRRIWELLDEKCRAAGVLAERFADGRATREELKAARGLIWEGDDRGFPALESCFMGQQVVRITLFPTLARRGDPDWKRRADAEWRSTAPDEDPDALRVESVRWACFAAASGAASESTWGRLTTAGRSLCTAYAFHAVSLARAGVPPDDLAAWDEVLRTEGSAQRILLSDILGNPFRRVKFAPAWRTSAALALARSMYEERNFEGMPVLGDALEEAGCTDAAILDHCHGQGPHTRGCWVVDLLLGFA